MGETQREIAKKIFDTYAVLLKDDYLSFLASIKCVNLIIDERLKADPIKLHENTVHWYNRVIQELHNIYAGVDHCTITPDPDWIGIYKSKDK